MGHLNGFFAPRGGNLTKPIFKSSNARGVARGGMLNFRIDRRIRFFCVSEPGKYDFSGEVFDWVVEFAGRLVACLVLFLYF